MALDLVLSAVPMALAAPRESRPNVLILLTDDQGWSDLRMQGPKDVATPKLNAMARAGIRFTDGYLAGPVCSAHRASLITGCGPTGVTPLGGEE